MRYRSLCLVFSALLATAGFAAPTAAIAQSTAQQQAQISDDDLKTFAVAAREVQQINQTYAPAYQAAQSDEQRAAIEDEAMGKMTQAVKDKGLSVEKYNQIVTAAQTDPEIARRVDDYAKQTQ
jgi:hypothetical protein